MAAVVRAATAAAAVRRPGRFEFTGWALLLTLLTPPVFACAVLVVVYTPLSIFIFLVPVLLFAVWLLRSLADLHRRIAGVITGRPVARPYRPTDGKGMFGRLLTVLGDPATWRDVIWGFATISVGLAMRCIVIELLFGGLWAAVLPCVWPAFPSATPTT